MLTFWFEDPVRCEDEALGTVSKPVTKLSTLGLKGGDHMVATAKFLYFSFQVSNLLFRLRQLTLKCFYFLFLGSDKVCELLRILFASSNLFCLSLSSALFYFQTNVFSALVTNGTWLCASERLTTHTSHLKANQKMMS